MTAICVLRAPVAYWFGIREIAGDGENTVSTAANALLRVR